MKKGLPAVLFVLLVASASAQPRTMRPSSRSTSDLVQLFSSIDRPVASVGESIVMTVDMLASPSNEAEKAYLSKAFRSLEPDLPEGDIEMVRGYQPAERSQRLELGRSNRTPLKLNVLHMQKRFVIRPKRDGLLEIPGLSLTFRGRRFETRVHELHAYSLEGDFLTAQRAVVPLVVESVLENNGTRNFLGTGSAFLAAEDALVTAYHVVVTATRITATLPNGHRLHIKKVWSIDPIRDVAVLYVDPDEVRRAGVTPLQMAPREPIATSRHSLEEDRVVFTTGWPGGVQQSEAGVLFRANQFYDDDAIWLSSNRVRPGDSGGPLLDQRGRVLGVISYGMSTSTEGTQILESVSTATDPRPALAERLLARHPSGLGAFRRDDFFDRYPQARVVKVLSFLTEFAHLRRRSDPAAVGLFLNELDAAVKQSDDVTRLHFLKGSIYQMLGDYEHASDAYEEALVQRTGHYPAAYSLAYCHLAKQSYEAAAELFDYTMRFEPYHDLAEYGLAQADMQLLRYDEAIYHLRRVIHHHESFAPALYLLGRAYLGKGDDPAAARILVKLEGVSPAWGELLERSIRLSPFRPVTREAFGKADVHTIGLPR